MNFSCKLKEAKTPQTPLTQNEYCAQCGFCIEILFKNFSARKEPELFLGGK